MKIPFLRLTFFASALVLSFFASDVMAKSSDKPNIIVILADDYGYGSAACYGGKGLQTPNLDRLAKEGRRFTQAYATGSVCSPTRYAIMTGRYFWRTSVKDGMVLPGNGPLHIETDRTTLASLCKSQGYRTAAVGKWHLGLGSNPQTDWNAPLKPGPRVLGFDYFFGLGANIGNPPPLLIENESVVNRIPGEKVNSEGGGKNKSGIDTQATPEAVMPKLTSKCVEWIKDNKNKKFFLYFAPNAIHEPITPGADFNGSAFGKYGDFITELDWSVGQILAALDKYKLTENTLVIFTSDNGGVAHEKNPSAGGAMKAGLKINGILRGGKHDIWEGGFREPFLVRWPGKVPAGTTSDDIVSSIDVMATLASILKTKIPAGNGEDSLDVSASFFGTGIPGRTSIVLQDASATYAIRQGDWKLIERENAPAFTPRGAKGQKRMAQAQKEAQHDELYNLADDPGETKDVAKKHPNILNRLRRILNETRDKSS